MQLTRRALEASRNFQADPDTAPASNLIVAAQITEDHQRKQAILEDAAKRLAHAEDRVKQAKQLVTAYLRNVKLRLPPVSDAQPAADSESMRRRFARDPLKAPARAAAPGEKDTSPPIEPTKSRDDDDRVDLQEVLDAISVLASAVQQSTDKQLIAVVEGAVSDCLLLASRYRKSPGVKAQLENAGGRLRRACQAWGTMKPELSLEDAQTQQAVDEAMSRGADVIEVQMIARFADEYDALKRAGYPSSMTREAYVSSNLSRIRDICEQEQNDE